MDYSKLNEITEPYAKEFTILGNLYDGDAISKHFLKDARKLYNTAYIKEVKAFLRVAWLEEKQRLWVMRFQIRTSADEKRKELKRDYAEKFAKFKREKPKKQGNKIIRWFIRLFRRRKKSEKSRDVQIDNSLIQWKSIPLDKSIALASPPAAHSKSEQNAVRHR